MTEGGNFRWKKQRGNYRWTPEQDNVLRDLHGLDWSGDDIAKQINECFGRAYTPDAVMLRARTTLKLARNNRRVVQWTEEMNDRLREAIAAGITIESLALNMDIGRGPIREQIRRLGIPFNSGRRTAEQLQATQTARETREARQRHELRLKKLLNFVPRQFRVSLPLPTTAEAVTDPRNLTLDTISRYDCKWIMNDDMSAPLYCGHRTTHGSWCAQHAKVVHGV